MIFMKRIHVFVSGRVQGVSFRAFAKREAQKFNIQGFARNLSDGRVEIVGEGNEEVLKEFLISVKMGHPIASVEHIDVEWSDDKGEFKDFSVVI
jgi:acylphosphatase